MIKIIKKIFVIFKSWWLYIFVIVPFVLKSVAEGLININGAEISEYTTGVAIALSVGIYLWLRLTIYAKRVFLSESPYGDYPYPIYWISSKFFGYQKISLIMKPYNIIFKILLQNLFVVIDEKSPIDEKVKVNVDKNDYKSSDKIHNIIIMDTHLINIDDIPEKNRYLSKIVIQREESKIAPRVFSQKMINEISEVFKELSKTADEIHLYMTINTCHAEAIVNDILRNRVKHEIFIHQQGYVTNDIRPFAEKGYKIIVDNI